MSGDVRECGRSRAFPADFRELSVGRQRQLVREHVQRQSGIRPDVPKVPRGKPADYYVCGDQYRAAKGNKKALYALIAQHLRLAEALLAQEDEKVRLSGLGVARYTLMGAAFHLKDQELAAALCEAWVIPNLDCAVEEISHPLRRDHVLGLCVGVVFEAGYFEQTIRYATRLRDVTIDRETADCARYKIATCLEKLNRIGEAAAELEGIHDASNIAPVKKRIPELKKLALRKPQDSEKTREK